MKGTWRTRSSERVQTPGVSAFHPTGGRIDPNLVNGRTRTRRQVNQTDTPKRRNKRRR